MWLTTVSATRPATICCALWRPASALWPARRRRRAHRWRPVRGASQRHRRGRRGHPVLRKLQTHLAENAELNGHALYPKTRIGVALGSGGFHNAEDLMRDADNAMHRSAAAQSTITVFQSAMHQQVMRDLQLESLLRAALREQLVAHFQPIVDLSTGLTTGFEALVRWPQQTPARSALTFSSPR
jgi:hypothetical protein